MMPRRSWDSLSGSYRARLERGGVSRSDYESGASLSKARGHAKTPEHPSDAGRNPERYRDYLRERQRPETGGGGTTDRDVLKRRAKENAHRVLGDAMELNRDFVFRNISRMTDEQLRRTARLSADQWRNLARNAKPGSYGSLLWYHGGRS